MNGKKWQLFRFRPLGLPANLPLGYFLDSVTQRKGLLLALPFCIVYCNKNLAQITGQSEPSRAP